MKRWHKFLLTGIICLCLTAPFAALAGEYSPPVKALKALYEKDAPFRDTMDKAFKAMQDPDEATAGLWPHRVTKNPWAGKTFTDLLVFFDAWYNLMPTPSGANDEFNYIERFGWFYYRNPYGQQIVGTEPGLGWSREFADARRRLMESPESAKAVAPWLSDPATHKEDYLIPPGGFKSFNDFFVRDLKPGARTIASPTDDAVLTAPTDCVLNVINPLTPTREIPTKGSQKLNVHDLLAGSPYARYFENGTALSCILLPDTYHHYHAVISGRIVEAREDIPGSYAGIKDFGAFVNRGNIGYGQSYRVFENFRRGYFVIRTEEYGHVAMVPVGLDTIGSVVFEEKYRRISPAAPVPVRKGEKLGHFAYGGSLVIVLVEQGISSITIPMGRQIGVFKSKKVEKGRP